MPVLTNIGCDMLLSKSLFAFATPDTVIQWPTRNSFDGLYKMNLHRGECHGL